MPIQPPAAAAPAAATSTNTTAPLDADKERQHYHLRREMLRNVREPHRIPAFLDVYANEGYLADPQTLISLLPYPAAVDEFTCYLIQKLKRPLLQQLITGDVLHHAGQCPESLQKLMSCFDYRSAPEQRQLADKLLTPDHMGNTVLHKLTHCPQLMYQALLAFPSKGNQKWALYHSNHLGESVFKVGRGGKCQVMFNVYIDYSAMPLRDHRTTTERLANRALLRQKTQQATKAVQAVQSARTTQGQSSPRLSTEALTARPIQLEVVGSPLRIGVRSLRSALLNSERFRDPRRGVCFSEASPHMVPASPGSPSSPRRKKATKP